MLKIKCNQELFDLHIEEISKSIKKLISKKLKSKLYPKEKACLEYIQENLLNILKADNSKMREFINYFRTNFPNAIGKSNIKEKNWTRIYKFIRKDIFEKEYDNWSNRTKYGVYTFVKTLDLKTCPYCNRNYTFIVDKNGKLRPEIDHFYPKSTYPFLAMSFYNLIPSCSICNHTKSSQFRNALINPYDIIDNDFKFTYRPTDISFSQVESKKYKMNSFDIVFEKNNDNIDIFKLNELYQQHKDIVIDLLVKKVYYPKSYIDELKSNFGFSEDEIYRYLLCNYQKDEDLHKRPLSKLIKDISEELNLLSP